MWVCVCTCVSVSCTQCLPLGPVLVSSGCRSTREMVAPPTICFLATQWCSKPMAECTHLGRWDRGQGLVRPYTAVFLLNVYGYCADWPACFLSQWLCPHRAVIGPRHDTPLLTKQHTAGEHNTDLHTHTHRVRFIYKDWVTLTKRSQEVKMRLRRGRSWFPVPVGSNSDWTLMSCGRPMDPSCSMNSEEDSSSVTTGSTLNCGQ